MNPNSSNKGSLKSPLNKERQSTRLSPTLTCSPTNKKEMINFTDGLLDEISDIVKCKNGKEKKLENYQGNESFVTLQLTENNLNDFDQ